MPSLVRTGSVLAILTVSLLAACSKKEEAPVAAAPEPAPVAAEPAAAASTSVFAFKIGELSAITLLDGTLELPNDNQVFGVGLKPEDVAAVLTANELPTDKLGLTVKPLLVKTADKVLLFDTGAGGNFGPGSGHLLATFAEAGVDPASVTDIFISHAHGDHIGGLLDAEGKLNFPGATIRLSKPEWAALSKQDAQAALVAAIKPKVDAFDPGAELIAGVVKAVDIKGHTPGHSGYLIGTGADSILYVGDSMHHYVVSVQKPEWTIAFDGDSKTATASRVALLNDLAASGQRVYAVHFPFPGVGKMQKQGDTVRWVAE
jgi:glyoxylase-like metal-dependent hydrolase (beta-lactamase superfamily II)